jgi:cytidylate kinase
VTISASYGAGGSLVAPAVARQLGFSFLDRAIPDADAPGLADPESATEEERTEGLLARLLSGFAAGPEVLAGGTPAPALGPDEQLRERAEARIEEFARKDGVILGWAGSLAVSAAFHVHLDGPEEARLRQAVSLGGIDRDAARRRQVDTDRVRATYVKRLYGRDWRDRALYHLVLDSTAVPLEACSQLIITAARAFWSR